MSLALGLFATLIALTVRRGATDPVCGMKVDRSRALAARHGSQTLLFCSEHCMHAFQADPVRFGAPIEETAAVPIGSADGR